MLVNYNVPPWQTIRNGHIFLVMIIPGPRQVSNADAYLRLIVDELKVLWEDGVQVQDMSREVDDGRSFLLRAILLWTMHDYARYTFISKMQTKGHRACPVCWRGLVAQRSKALQKMLYAGNFWRHLPEDHEFRERLKESLMVRWSTGLHPWHPHLGKSSEKANGVQQF